MIKTEAEIKTEKIARIKRLLHFFGGEIHLDRPIRFRLTPHTRTKYIYHLSIDENFDEYNEELDTIEQRLKWIKYENTQERRN